MHFLGVAAAQTGLSVSLEGARRLVSVSLHVFTLRFFSELFHDLVALRASSPMSALMLCAPWQCVFAIALMGFTSLLAGPASWTVKLCDRPHRVWSLPDASYLRDTATGLL